MSVACTGNIDEDPIGLGPGVVIGDPEPLDCSGLQPGRAPLRRLTVGEYDNIVRDLFGDMSAPASRLIDNERDVISADVRIVSTTLATQYVNAAEDVAERATEDLEALLGCAPSNECLRAFIETRGRLAYRRPLEVAEVDAALRIYEAIETNQGPRGGVQAVIELLLQNPSFLYRVELPTPDAIETAPGIVRLGAYELASRLSFLLWQTTPDGELLDRAAAGDLDTDEGVERVAREMLADARSRPAVAAFFNHYLELGKLDTLTKDAATFPDFTPEIAALYGQETEAFVAEVLASENGSWETLLTADWTMMNGPLSDYYGIGDVEGDAFVRVELDGRYHSGLLTHGSITATRGRSTSTDPVHRGMFVRAKLLCGDIPDVPEGLQIEAPDPDPTLTYREQLEEHRSNPECAACHRLTDPLGFALEHFDGDGRFQADDNGLPIDATGEIYGSDVNGAFDGAPELAGRIIGSDEAKACFGTAFFEYSAGRAISGDFDACSLQSMVQRFADGNLDIRELIVATTQTDAFLHRVVDQDVFPAPPLEVEMDLEPGDAE
ncbi:MAG: DUF1592 domain-containing protein [Myxococcota bacterium]